MTYHDITVRRMEKGSRRLLKNRWDIAAASGCFISMESVTGSVLLSA